MSKNKFFVVWEGKEPGIYRSWDECKRQIHGYEGAKFKGFATGQLLGMEKETSTQSGHSKS